MNELDKMQHAVQYITECKWTRKTVDCHGNKLNIGLELDSVNLIRDLGIFIGKAQVYIDKKEFANFDMMVDAFWNVFEEDFDKNDFEDYMLTFYEEENE